MMSSKHTLVVAAFVAVIVAGIAMPGATEAYVPPEELLSDLGAYIGPRDARMRVEEQQNVSELRRTEEQAAFFSLQHPPQEDERALVRTDADEQFAAAAENSPTAIIEALTHFLMVMEEQKPETPEQRRTQRIIERLTLHGGAPLDECEGGVCQVSCRGGICRTPLARTGAGTVITMLSLLAVGAWTVRRSSKATAVRSAGL
jgi:hypothetical protein